MTKIDYYLQQDPPEGEQLRVTPKQRRVWREVIENRQQMPSEVAEKADVDHSYVKYVLKRTTEDDLEEFKESLLKGEDLPEETPEGHADGVDETETLNVGDGRVVQRFEGDAKITINIFSDLTASEVREML